jgi:transcription initiation factor IIE alpha subunit
MEPTVYLVKLVMRMFYEREHVVLMDMLLRSGVISEDKLAERMHTTSKQVSKAATLLRDDGYVMCEPRQEFREHDGKPITRVYWRTNLDGAVGTTRARIQRMAAHLGQQLRASVHGEAQGYRCPQCRTVYGLINVNRIVDPIQGTLVCEVCKWELGDEDEVGGDQVQLAALYKLLMQETKAVTSLLKQIEVETKKRQLEQQQTAQPSQVLGEESKALPTFAEMRTTQPAKELPRWHSHSTVSGQQVKSVSPMEGNLKDAHSKRTGIVSDVQVEDYYARIVSKRPSTSPEMLEESSSTAKRTKVEGDIEGREEEDKEVAEIMVMAGGRSVPLVAVTEADREAMTLEENVAYLNAYVGLFGDI